MSNLKEQLRDDVKVAMKQGKVVKRNLIRTILGEVSTLEKKVGGKIMDDADVQTKIMKKFIDNIKETEEKLGKLSDEAGEELVILEAYMPTLMAEEEIEKIVSGIIADKQFSGARQVGLVMREFTTEYKGKADNKVVSKIAARLLA